MKKIIILLLAMLITAAFYYASAQRTAISAAADEPGAITTLVVDAKVTVVLVNNDKTTFQMTGDNALIEPVTLTRTGDTLVISSVKKKNYRESRVVYVSANQLRKIQVNTEAHILSMQALHIPKLDVVINGECRVDISNVGELNFIETDKYYFEKSTEIRRFPVGVL